MRLKTGNTYLLHLDVTPAKLHETANHTSNNPYSNVLFFRKNKLYSSKGEKKTQQQTKETITKLGSVTYNDGDVIVGDDEMRRHVVQTAAS